MATVKELKAEVDALRAEVAALRAELSARPGWIQVIPAPAQPYHPNQPVYPTVTYGTSTNNPARLTVVPKGA